MDVHPALFSRQMRLLAALGFRARPIEEWILEPGTSPAPGKRWFAITFDDGYQNILENALPLLRRLGFRASVYPVVSRIGTTGSWPQEDRRRRFMGWEGLRALRAAGWRVGSHGMEHRSLSSLDERQLLWELRCSRRVLEDELGGEVTAVSYPYGHVNGGVVRAARRTGYRLGLTLYAARPDIFRLPRLEVGRRMGMGRFVVCLLRWVRYRCALPEMAPAGEGVGSGGRQQGRGHVRPAGA